MRRTRHRIDVDPQRSPLLRRSYLHGRIRYRYSPSTFRRHAQHQADRSRPEMTTPRCTFLRPPAKAMDASGIGARPGTESIKSSRRREGVGAWGGFFVQSTHLHHTWEGRMRKLVIALAILLLP